jgi:hypothetical protein
MVLVIVFFVVAIVWQPSEAGAAFGDFLGGTLNPLLTFLTFMALLITIVLQQTELGDTRKELAASAKALEAQHVSLDRQNFESTFFQMLTLHNTIVNSIDLKWSARNPSSNSAFDEGTARESIGRDCFRQFYANYISAYQAVGFMQDDQERLQAAYDQFWELRQQDLAHYYRYLYNVLRFVYEYKGIDDKLRYVKLLRAQLSDFELALLYYNALNKNGVNYWIYIHEYQIFDNLPLGVLIDPSHKALFSDRSFGEPKVLKPHKWPPAAIAAEYEAEKSAAASFETSSNDNKSGTEPSLQS